jgi:hypothetical protein
MVVRGRVGVVAITSTIALLIGVAAVGYWWLARPRDGLDCGTSKTRGYGTLDYADDAHVTATPEGAIERSDGWGALGIPDAAWDLSDDVDPENGITLYAVEREGTRNESFVFRVFVDGRAKLLVDVNRVGDGYEIGGYSTC